MTKLDLQFNNYFVQGKKKTLQLVLQSKLYALN